MNSNNSQSNEAEKVEESLRDFIGRVRCLQNLINISNFRNPKSLDYHLLRAVQGPGGHPRRVRAEDIRCRDIIGGFRGYEGDV